MPENLTIFQQLKAAMTEKAKLAETISSHEKIINEITENFNTAVSEKEVALKDLEKAKADTVTANSNLEEAKKQVEALQTEINGLKATAKSVEDQVAEKMAELGFPENKLPSLTKGNSTQDLFEKYKTSSDPVEKTKLWREHKTEFLKLRK